MPVLKTLGTLISGSPELRAQVDQADHIAQVRVYANVTSKAAFARALINAGLAHRDPAAVVRDISPYLHTPKFMPDLEPGVVYVGALNGRPNDPLIPVTPKEH